MFKGPQNFGRMMNITMCVAMCAVLSFVIPLTVEMTYGISGVLTPINYLQGFVLSYFVSYLWGDLVPAVMWGMKLAGSMNLKGLLAHLVKCVVVALAYVTLIAFSMAFVNNVVEGGLIGVFSFFIMIYPPALGVGFLAIALSLPVCNKIAVAVTGFDPAKAHAQITA